MLGNLLLFPYTILIDVCICDSICRIWLELSTGKESDWATIFEVYKRGFQNDVYYKFTHPDPEKRRRFLEKNIEYLYDAGLKDGRGYLVLIKIAEFDDDKEGKIIGGLTVTVDWDEKDDSKVQSMKDIDEEGWRRDKK